MLFVQYCPLDGWWTTACIKRLSADQHLTRDLKGFTDRMQYDTGQLAAVDSLQRIPTNACKAACGDRSGIAP
jgi:hypothetical protein